MELETYFKSTKGKGVLSTADADGTVNSAIYSRPHFIDNKLAFIMRDRLSHKNLQSNPRAAYLFVEEGPGYKGKRLMLTKVSEEKNAAQIQTLQRRKYDETPDEDRFLVFFELDQELPLIGSDDEAEE